VPDAVPSGDGLEGLVAPGVAAQATHFSLTAVNSSHTGEGKAAPTSVTLFDQGLLQVLEASVTGLVPGQSYVLALAPHPDGSGELQPLSQFTANPAGAAIVNAIGPIRQIVQTKDDEARRFLVIASQPISSATTVIQVQVP
jgi:hypothetical protein